MIFWLGDLLIIVSCVIVELIFGGGNLLLCHFLSVFRFIVGLIFDNLFDGAIIRF